MAMTGAFVLRGKIETSKYLYEGQVETLNHFGREF